MKWEYMTVKASTVSAWGNLHLDEKALNQSLNLHGWDGWELVSTSALTGTTITQEIALFFKRPVNEAASPPR